MNTCGTCKYFGAVVHSYDDHLGAGADEHIEAGRYHACELVRHKNSYDDRKRGFNGPRSEKAIVVDGSGYFAALCVSEEFGCTEWQQRQS